MTTYERVDERGNVIETVTPLDGDHEDTRLGCAVLDGTGEWRIAGTEQPADDDPTDPPAQEPPAQPTAPRTRQAKAKDEPKE
ncbi:hypothetical protein SUDANB95_05514 [Actinosynnema sp. ALI-1.44]